jgi:hypothetical protein
MFDSVEWKALEQKELDIANAMSEADRGSSSLLLRPVYRIWSSHVSQRAAVI